MGRYDDLLAGYGHRGLRTDMEPLTAAQMSAINEEYAGLPADYLDFLAEVGWGNMNDSYVLYSGPMGPEAIYDPKTADGFNGIVLIGDDFGGVNDGFEPMARALIEIDSADMRVVPHGMSFEDFIREKVAALYAAD